MKPRYILAPEAAEDLVEIWRYIQQQSSWKWQIMWNRPEVCLIRLAFAFTSV